jgi:hypothetical protein
MNCTDAYREALIQDFQARSSPAEATDSGQVTPPGTGQDDISTER